MTIPEIRQELARLAYAHPLADTNVHGIQNVGTDIEFQFDVSGLESELADARRNEEATANDLKDAEKRAALDEIKDPDSGVTVAALIERTQEAEASAEDAQALSRQWRHAKEEIERECVALRKRKGISANLFRCQSDILTLLATISTYPQDSARWAGRVKELRDKLHAP